ncbi:hypothetical protein ACVWZV_000900 [Bradyrhizobium sp. GM5.1]
MTSVRVAARCAARIACGASLKPVNRLPLTCLRAFARGAGLGMRFTSPDKTIEPLRTMKEDLMAQILKFPTRKIEPVTVRSGSKHRISVEVLDSVRPRRTRWRVQFEIQEAAGFAALKGFTDRAVARGDRHRFYVSRTRAVQRFVAETSGLVAAGKIAIWIDGLKVQPQVARSA